MLKSSINAVAGKFGYQFRRKPKLGAPSPSSSTRESFVEGLQHVERFGWTPASVLDIGAAHAKFTRACYELFPNANYLLVEPLMEFRASLNAIPREIPRSIIESVAVGNRNGTAMIHVHRDWDGSSLYRETEGPQVDGVERKVPLKTLDTLVREHRLPGPYLLKVDVQGAELDVLSGALKTLPQCEYVLLETTFFQFFIGGAQFADIIDFMRERGFVVYDLFGLLYRPLDGALAQADVAFVPKDGIFRQHHHYASPEQRAEQDRRFAQYHNKELAQVTPDA
ncbi:MAG TPA: FkbM family methyltransferase [Anaerolineae bacterium]|nr:FkbM family methyltransferase [Anaerolineae bacterium]